MKKEKCFQASLVKLVARLIASAGLLLLLHPFLLKGIFQELVRNNDPQLSFSFALNPEGNVPEELYNSNAVNSEETSESLSAFLAEYFTGSAANPKFCQLLHLRYSVHEGVPFLLFRSKTIPTPPPEC